MSLTIAVKPSDLAIVLQILKKNLPKRAHVWVFGSRAENKSKPFSDLDLAIDAKIPLPYATLVDLKNDFADSDLPFKVDIVDWNRIDSDFQERIEKYRCFTSLGR